MIDQEKIVVVVLSLLMLLSACQSDRKPAKPGVIDPVELQAFADTFFSEQMETLHIPGVVFVFVQGGEVIYAKGYGTPPWKLKLPSTRIRASCELVQFPSRS